ncbi:MAG: poly-gamma-glutamate system protein [Candidatus Zixiibacteriota bacterium]
MKEFNRNISLVAILLVSIGLMLIINRFFTHKVERLNIGQMNRAAELSIRWFDEIDKLKMANGIEIQKRDCAFPSLIGEEYSPMTTTLGSLEAKISSSNPDFAALLVSMLIDARIDSTSTIGLIISGSFPSLAIVSLAALQIVNANVILISSLGASTYGANQEGATWLDMEKWLHANGLKYNSEIVTIGSENDNGGGLTGEGVAMILASAERNNIELFVPENITDAIEYKTKLLSKRNIDLLINIGGNQASLGACAHASTIPNGFHQKYEFCTDADRGIIARMSEQNIPFINMLNIRDLAVKNGISLKYDSERKGLPELYYRKSISKPATAGALFIIILMLTIQNKYLKNIIQPYE